MYKNLIITALITERQRAARVEENEIFKSSISDWLFNKLSIIFTFFKYHTLTYKKLFKVYKNSSLTLKKDIKSNFSLSTYGSQTNMAKHFYSHSIVDAK